MPSITNASFAVFMGWAILLHLTACDQQSTPSGNSGTNTGTADFSDAGVWTNTERELYQLAPAYAMGPYEICPPVTFRFIKFIKESNTYYWVGPVRADETYAQLMVMLTPLPAKATNASLMTMFTDVLSGIRRQRTTWSQSQPESGTIDGVTFVRASWIGVVADNARQGLAGRTMRGVVYVAKHGNIAIQIMCQDVEPDHVEAMKLGRMAALTFRVTK